MLARELQPLNALLPILSPLVITTSLRSVFWIELIATAGIVAFSIGQSKNALSPIEVTLSGMTILVNP